MRKLLSILFVLALPGVVCAALDVEWIDGNTIRVSGDGYNVVTNYVCTNSLGTCTNCVQISPEQMRAYKNSIISLCDFAENDFDDILDIANAMSVRVDVIEDDISMFQRYNKTMSYGSVSNFLYKLPQSTQRDLSLANFQSASGSLDQKAKVGASYANGIFDFANQYVLPDIRYFRTQADTIAYDVTQAKSHVSTIKSTVQGMSEEPCQGCGDDGGGGGSCGDCPCAEQLDSIEDYIEHIDDDFHEQLKNMSAVTNFIPRMDSYAKLVSRILYNDSTIVVDDGENSWSNVYRRGESDLYDYDRSNILQRIELLLYGLVSNTSTNWGSATSDVESDVTDMQDTIDDVRASVSDANTEYSSEINTISHKVTDLFHALNFFGAGRLSNFAYGEPMQFDVYDFQFDFTNAADFAPLQLVCRTAMQIFYWTAGVVFMLVFWYRVVKFTVDFALRVIHFFNNLLT